MRTANAKEIEAIKAMTNGSTFFADVEKLPGIKWDNSLKGMIGFSGTKVHRFKGLVKDDEIVLGHSPICGSAKFSSGIRINFDDKAVVTCKKCILTN
jgi:hypothetical protein